MSTPYASMWADFLAWAGWLHPDVLGEIEADWAEGQWLLYQLRCKQGDRPGMVRI